MFGTVNDLYLWKIHAQAIHYRIRIGIHDDLSNLRDSQQRLDNVMEQRPAGQHTIILAKYALAVMAHRDKSDKLEHSYDSTLRFNCLWHDIDLEPRQSDKRTDTQNNNSYPSKD